MIDYFQNFDIQSLTVFFHILAYSIVGIVFLIISKWSFDFLSHYHLNEQLMKKDNPAVGLSLTGYFIALIIIFGGVVPGSRGNMTLIMGLESFAIYSILGILLLNFSRLITDKLILYNLKIKKELLD